MFDSIRNSLLDCSISKSTAVTRLIALLTASILSPSVLAGGTDYVTELRGDIEANDVAIDDSGNTYVVGKYASAAYLEPGIDTPTLMNDGGRGAFVCKYDSDGVLVWATAIDGTESDDVTIYGVAVDSDGNVYSSGMLEGTADFDPGEGTLMLTSHGFFYGGSFIQKLDSDGSLVWAMTFPGAFSDQSNNIAIDDLGNVYTAGSFEGTVDFDPGDGVFDLTAQDLFFGGYVLKLDTDGNLVWAKSLSVEAGSGTVAPGAIALDGSDNVHTTGRFVGLIDFDPGPDTAYLDQSKFNFLLKLDTNGNYLWASTVDPGINEIAADSAGNVYAAGHVFPFGDPGPTRVPSSLRHRDDVWISKFDPSGDFVWDRTVDFDHFGIEDPSGGALGSRALDITVDFDGNPHISGSFGSTVVEIQQVPVEWDSDGFVMKWSADGDLTWTETIAVHGRNGGKGLTVDASGNVLTIGSPLNFNLGELVHSPEVVGTYLHKLSSGRVGSVITNLAPEEIMEGARLELNGPAGSGYQWLKNGAPLTDGGSISDTTTQTLVIDPLSMEDSGVYSCLYETGTPRAPARSEGISVDVRESGSGGGGGCLIATFAHGTPLAKELDTVRAFRDSILLNNPIGSRIAGMYYRLGPGAIHVASNSKAALTHITTVSIVASLILSLGLISRRRKNNVESR